MEEANGSAKKEGSASSSSSKPPVEGRKKVEREDEGDEGIDAPTPTDGATADHNGKDHVALKASTTAAATWTCTHCSLVNDEPDLSFVQQGGVISCSVCLMVRGQEAWLCPSCNYMNTSLKAKACKMCASTAYGGRASGGGRGDDIARDYKRRKRVLNKPRSSSSGGASANAGGGGGDQGRGACSVKREAPPSLKGAATTDMEVIRTEHSHVFGQQLKTMHLLVRGLQTFPAFRDAVMKFGVDSRHL